jgi:hypothetical protein
LWVTWNERRPRLAGDPVAAASLGFLRVPLLPLLGPRSFHPGLAHCSLSLQVVFGKKLPAFALIPIHQLQHEKKYDIYFADGKVFALYR